MLHPVFVIIFVQELYQVIVLNVLFLLCAYSPFPNKNLLNRIHLFQIPLETRCENRSYEHITGEFNK